VIARLSSDDYKKGVNMITQEQKDARKKCIGGSDVPIILGLSKYKTPYELWLEKTGIINEDYEENEYQYWGSRLESIIADEFAKRNNLTIEYPDTIKHPQYDFMAGNLDGFIPSLNAVLEIKCSSQYMSHEWGEPGTDAIPMPYLVQVAFYCIISNADKAFLAVLIGGNTYKEYIYNRDRALEQFIVNACVNFWECVLNKKEPEFVNSYDVIKKYPTHESNKSISANEKLILQLQKIKESREKIKNLIDIQEKHKFQIIKEMQDAESIIDANGEALLTFKKNKKGTRVFLIKGEA